MGLSCIRLSHSYDGKLYIFRELSFSVESGEILALTGPNGSGKTTLLRILCGLLTPTNGQVLLDGLSSSNSTRAFNKKTGWVPAQETGFFSRLSGLDNLLFFASFYGIREREVRFFVDKWKEIEPLERALSTPFSLCSSGMKRSLLLLRALVHRPDFLLMDEPFTHFDQHVTLAVVEKLRKYSEGAKIIFSTHTKEQADLLGARPFLLGENS